MSGPEVPARVQAGTSPAADSAATVRFCRSCATVLAATASVCPSCGTAVVANSRSQTTAVLLAVCLGPWTWVYTWKKDWWKFWLAVVLVPAAAYFWVFSRLVGSITSDFIEVMFALVAVIVFLLRALFTGEGITVWLVAWIAVGWLPAVILAATRPRAFYERYPDDGG